MDGSFQNIIDKTKRRSIQFFGGSSVETQTRADAMKKMLGLLDTFVEKRHFDDDPGGFKNMVNAFNQK